METLVLQFVQAVTDGGGCKDEQLDLAGQRLLSQVSTAVSTYLATRSYIRTGQIDNGVPEIDSGASAFNPERGALKMACAQMPAGVQARFAADRRTQQNHHVDQKIGTKRQRIEENGSQLLSLSTTGDNAVPSEGKQSATGCVPPLAFMPARPNRTISRGESTVAFSEGSSASVQPQGSVASADGSQAPHTVGISPVGLDGSSTEFRHFGQASVNGQVLVAGSLLAERPERTEHFVPHHQQVQGSIDAARFPHREALTLEAQVPMQHPSAGMNWNDVAVGTGTYPATIKSTIQSRLGDVLRFPAAGTTAGNFSDRTWPERPDANSGYAAIYQRFPLSFEATPSSEMMRRYGSAQAPISSRYDAVAPFHGSGAGYIGVAANRSGHVGVPSNSWNGQSQSVARGGVPSGTDSGYGHNGARVQSPTTLYPFQGQYMQQPQQVSMANATQQVHLLALSRAKDDAGMHGSRMGQPGEVQLRQMLTGGLKSASGSSAADVSPVSNMLASGQSGSSALAVGARRRNIRRNSRGSSAAGNEEDSTHGSSESGSDYEPATFSAASGSRGSWTPAEDAILRRLVLARGARNWRDIAGEIPGRAAKQCRERWHHHLDPSIRTGPWSIEEDQAIVALRQVHGNRWAEIARHPSLHGRTDNSVKNRYNSNLKRREPQLLQDATGAGTGNAYVQGQLQMTQAEVGGGALL